MNYGRAIRAARDDRDISQKELARLTKLSGNYISMIESGRRVPSVEALETIAKAMGIPLYLLALLGSDAEDLQGIPLDRANLLAKEFLDMTNEKNREGEQS